MRPGNDPVYVRPRTRRLAPEAVRRRRLLGWSLIIRGLVVLLATFSASLPLAAIGLGLTAAGLAFVFGGGPLAAGMRPHRRGP